MNFAHSTRSSLVFVTSLIESDKDGRVVKKFGKSVRTISVHCRILRCCFVVKPARWVVSRGQISLRVFYTPIRFPVRNVRNNDKRTTKRRLLHENRKDKHGDPMRDHRHVEFCFYRDVRYPLRTPSSHAIVFSKATTAALRYRIIMRFNP